MPKTYDLNKDQQEDIDDSCYAIKRAMREYEDEEASLEEVANALYEHLPYFIRYGVLDLIELKKRI